MSHLPKQADNLELSNYMESDDNEPLGAAVSNEPIALAQLIVDYGNVADR
jgi:hypothetical protein